MTSADQIVELSRKLKEIRDNIKRDERNNVTSIYPELLTQADNHIKNEPNKDWITCIHVIGESRSMKTSYTLDLYDNSELRAYLAVELGRNNDSTACPCMIIPKENMTTKISVDKVNIDDPGQSKTITTIEEFHEYYILPRNDEARERKAGGYFLKVFIPQERCKFQHTAIEYPGIDSKKHGSEEDKALYNRMAEEFIACFSQTPGFIVACFRNRIDIADNHPLGFVIDKYKDILSQNKSQPLPLILSFNGQEAVQNYTSGLSDLVGDLENRFVPHKRFNTQIQLTNPNRKEKPISWLAHNKDDQKQRVKNWIERLTDYANYNELKTIIDADGGFEYSRNLLDKIVKDRKLWSNIGYFFHSDWLEEGTEILKELEEAQEDINNSEHAEKIREHIRERLCDFINAPYESVYDIYDTLSPPLDIHDANQHDQEFKSFWEDLIFKYYSQFIPEDKVKLCRDPENAKKVLRNKIVGELFKEILLAYAGKYASPRSLAFPKEKEMNNALLAILGFYLPNQIIKGNNRLLTALSGQLA